MRLAFKSKDKSYHVLKKHQTRKLDRLNQPVTISDIVVRQSDKGRGEFQYKNPYRHMKFPTLKRMRDMVALVADIATEYHLQNHFSHDENGQRSLKEGHENEVTRLLFHEAAFYTPSPLTKKDFDKLLTAIERMASSLPENLYLLLSSFPVAINENHYVNQVVHVQCGAVPKLTIFTKITPSGFDPLFPNMKCIHYSSEKRKPVQDDLAMSVLPDNENTPVIDYSCTLKCQTSGGAEFFSVIEICKDHFFKEGYNQ